jgi:phage baseplate assembly protein W
MAPKPKTYAVLRADLAMTRYTGTAGSVPLEFADSWGAVDLAVVPGGRGGLRTHGSADIRDLGVVEGRANLAQALILRLVTPQGGLTALGHPEYGSRLAELIGLENNDRVRHLARLFTLQALAQEPRVSQVLDLKVGTTSDAPDTIRIGFSVVPKNDDETLSLLLDVKL